MSKYPLPLPFEPIPEKVDPFHRAKESPVPAPPGFAKLPPNRTPSSVVNSAFTLALTVVIAGVLPLFPTGDHASATARAGSAGTSAPSRAKTEAAIGTDTRRDDK